MKKTAGVTLVEVMVAFMLFAAIAVGAAATLITSRKSAESNIYAVQAQTIALSIMEQVQLTPYATLAIATTPPPIALKFVAASSTNNSTIQVFNLDWALDPPNPTIFTPIGEVNGGIVRGVLLDLDYKNSTTGAVIRQKRYMNMNVNLRKTVDNVSGNVGIILTYQWQIPDRRASGTMAPIFLSRQIRSARSQTPSY